MQSKLDVVILWQDDDILVVNKPAGLRSVTDGYDSGLPYLSSVLSSTYGDLWVVHRLDLDTSGVVVLARNEKAHRELCQQFTRRQVSKIYHALVVGSPEWDNWSLELPLRVNGDRRHRTVVDFQRGKFARTHFKVLERFESYALIESKPETGRTHQVRVHLKEVGIPLVADGLYGRGESLFLSNVKPGYMKSKNKPERPLLDRMGLHARALTIKHPRSREVNYFEANYPKDLALALKQLRRYSCPEQKRQT
jgi:RluA family pseudouridine synthase